MIRTYAVKFIASFDNADGQLKERNEENNGEQNTVDSPEDLQ